MEQPGSKRYSEETRQAYQSIVTDWVYNEIRSFLGKGIAITSNCERGRGTGDTNELVPILESKMAI